MNRTTSQSAYLRTQILTAGPAELRLMLFDGSIRFAQQAREGLTEKNYEKAFNGFARAQDIVMELINSLQPQHDPDLCEQLSSLYTFIYQRLVTASTDRDIDLLDEALHLLRYERETWALLLEKLVEENTSAGNLDETPETAAHSGETAPIADSRAAQLVGGRVSVKG